ncbi:AMP-dependent synthetase/ligase [Geobacter argillaceus]|uniref:Long-chain acyl-CoA synthetase n=1 Tax=Geobacter argillaceus TaxID=345631 RepID=A0A562VPM5_9BACT|nr:long-chain fatty acid--CoA ligase [Geobacter argillaceus]TWJ19850.1 long-chain acyl-CoA synthetase [Geobacter argillaceus]
MSEIPYKSIPDMLRKNAAALKGKLALKYRKQREHVTLSYAQYYLRALMAARGLRKLNMQPGDRIAILSENRAGWVIADMGILAARGVTVPVYATNTPEQIEYVLNHSGAWIVFVSTKFQYSKLLKIREAIPQVKQVISFERFLGDPKLPVCTFYQLSEIDLPITEDEQRELEAEIDLITPDDLLTVIYTSGTTGVPKGVMLTHGNILFDAWYGAKKAAIVSERDTFLSFLPLSHVFERTVGYYLAIMRGALMAFADSIEKVPENMQEVKPTIMICVPRLFEKIYSRIFETVHKMPLVKRWLFHWALRIGKEYVDTKYVEQREPAFATRAEYALADLLIFRKLREIFGGNMRAFCSGGAPLDKTINEFFWIIGLPILEGYGLTETSPIVTINTREAVRFGSIGTVLEYTEVKCDKDGELLVKGPQVMAGYYNDPEATRQTIEDGWFRTGDIGHIDDGFVYITDRKKELIITAGGKNIAPQPVENELKLDKYISQSYVYGDRKPYLVALLVPNFERIVEYAREHHINYYDMDDLVMNEEIESLLTQRVAEINSRLAQYESIKKFVLLPRDFSIDGGELTPTLKLRRKVIHDKYKDRIERMYAENGN